MKNWKNPPAATPTSTDAATPASEEKILPQVQMLPHLGQLRSPTKNSSLTNTNTIPHKYKYSFTEIQKNKFLHTAQHASGRTIFDSGLGGNHRGLVTNLSQILEGGKIDKSWRVGKHIPLMVGMLCQGQKEI